MVDSKLEIQLPEDLIRTTLIAEMAKHMPNREQVIQSVIEMALTEKAERYGDETKFSAAMKKAIREMAETVFHDWLETQKEAIKTSLLQRLSKDKHKVLKKIVDDLATGLSNVNTSVLLRIE